VAVNQQTPRESREGKGIQVTKRVKTGRVENGYKKRTDIKKKRGQRNLEAENVAGWVKRLKELQGGYQGRGGLWDKREGGEMTGIETGWGWEKEEKTSCQGI